MNDDGFDPAALANAIAPLLGLQVTPAQRPGVLLHLAKHPAHRHDHAALRAAGAHRERPGVPLVSTAAEIAADVRAGRVAAVDVTTATLARIAARDAQLGAFTDVTRERVLAEAAAVDAKVAAGADPGPLAGVPYAVKNLFDIEGLATRAGSKINRDDPPAARDAVLIERLQAAGAVLLGGLNMGEYAYDFTGENAHDGPSRNPHDPAHMSGGSSGGCGTAVAAGMVPLSLGSDTNGSIRVPSSFCGLFGLKPTYGRLPRTGSFPFVDSLDHLGPFARSPLDLALAYDAMQGPDAGDAACTAHGIEPVAPTLDHSTDGLRIAMASGYFRDRADEQALRAVGRCAEALGVTREVEIPGAAEARAAAYVITNIEGAALHMDRLAARADDFDPDVRDRLLAGTMVPPARGSWAWSGRPGRRSARRCRAGSARSPRPGSG